MDRLSACIFEWDPDDVAELRRAKQSELLADGRTADSQVISRRELALHCWRITRGTEVTTSQIERLLLNLGGDSGKDSLGVPLIDVDHMGEI